MPELITVDSLRGALAQLGTKIVIDPDCRRFRHPALAEALVLWSEKSAGRSVPCRRDFTPQTMHRFLKHVALMERIDQQFGAYRYRARLTGPEFTRAFTDLTGKFIDEAVPKAFIRRWKLILDAVIAMARPIRLVGVPEAFNRDHSVVEILLAPLCDEAGKCNQILSVANFERGAVWTEVEAEELRALALA